VVPETLLTVLAAGGSALVGAVATDAWQTARDGLIRLFGTAGPRRAELAARWVDEMTSDLDGPEAAERPDAERQWARIWQQRLYDLAEEYPEIGADLQVWTESVLTRLPAEKRASADMFVSRDHSQQYNAPGGSITVHHHSGNGPAPG
jgi:hypothetical protein